MHASSVGEDLSDEEEMVSDPDARGSGDAVCGAGRRWGSESSPSAGENSTAGNVTNNSPRVPNGDNWGDADGDMDQNANAN